MDANPQLARWRHLIESELQACATPLSWAELVQMDVRVYERNASVLVTRDSVIGGHLARSMLVAAGTLAEVVSMVTEMEADAAAYGIHKILFVGRRGWLQVLSAYREIAVIGERTV